MERHHIHPDEMNLRSDLDHIASLHMIGEGAPDFSKRIAHRPAPPPEYGFDEHELPRDYQ
ncbi:hypothetical protein NCCP2716_09760 [Sporosarcina sp. NCCP-2716]|uniref:hypothetical protein n=1 Tax=Sporosarcina sp. NCCP-2716 TaxID=2943679 RepID=UPI00203E6186|nr:hypothetical protein [Sporosarcina sp. NCCP-2716]GKV68478.1 hypothetical protein NCCP2716_09760 [Sporosarcina sp. NCCP-2716]